MIDSRDAGLLEERIYRFLWDYGIGVPNQELTELLRSDDPLTGSWDGSETALLDTCEEMWRTNLSRWKPPEWPAEVTLALEELLARAKKEFYDT